MCYNGQFLFEEIIDSQLITLFLRFSLLLRNSHLLTTVSFPLAAKKTKKYIKKSHRRKTVSVYDIYYGCHLEIKSTAILLQPHAHNLIMFIYYTPCYLPIKWLINQKYEVFYQNVLLNRCKTLQCSRAFHNIDSSFIRSTKMIRFSDTLATRQIPRISRPSQTYKFPQFLVFPARQVFWVFDAQSTLHVFVSATLPPRSSLPGFRYVENAFKFPWFQMRCNPFTFSWFLICCHPIQVFLSPIHCRNTTCLLVSRTF